MAYYKLMDSEHSGEIVKVSKDHKEWKYDVSSKKWVSGNYMMDYFLSFFDESPYTEESYMEISEEEALKQSGGLSIV